MVPCRWREVDENSPNEKQHDEVEDDDQTSRLAPDRDWSQPLSCETAILGFELAQEMLAIVTATPFLEGVHIHTRTRHKTAWLKVRLQKLGPLLLEFRTQASFGRSQLAGDQGNSILDTRL